VNTLLTDALLLKIPDVDVETGLFEGREFLRKSEMSCTENAETVT
jgi:hypothetical protein